MANFNHPPAGQEPLPPQHFDGPIQDDLEDEPQDEDWDDLPPEDPDEDLDLYDDDLSDEERREARRGRFRVAAGVSELHAGQPVRIWTRERGL